MVAMQAHMEGAGKEYEVGVNLYRKPEALRRLGHYDQTSVCSLFMSMPT
jgi:hypothetical protein